MKKSETGTPNAAGLEVKLEQLYLVLRNERRDCEEPDVF